jgi:ketosteroid isomerase-like protein
MSTQSVAQQLVALCREGKNMEALELLYADDIVSIEHPNSPNPRTEGKVAVTQKSIDWYDNVQDFHGGEISDPIVAGNHFSCSMSFDITFKKGGRIQMEEICVYQVADDQIVSEQFFYAM